MLGRIFFSVIILLLFLKAFISLPWPPYLAGGLFFVYVLYLLSLLSWSLDENYGEGWGCAVMFFFMGIPLLALLLTFSTSNRETEEYFRDLYFVILISSILSFIIISLLCRNGFKLILRGIWFFLTDGLPTFIIWLKYLRDGSTFKSSIEKKRQTAMVKKKNKEHKEHLAQLSELMDEIREKEKQLSKLKQKRGKIMQSSPEIIKFLAEDLTYLGLWGEFERRLEEGIKRKSLTKIRERVEEENRLNQEIAQLRRGELELVKTLHETEVDSEKLKVKRGILTKKHIADQARLEVDTEDKELQLKNIRTEKDLEEAKRKLEDVKGAPDRKDRKKEELDAIKLELLAEQELKNLLKENDYPEEDIETIMMEYRQRIHERRRQ